MVIRTIHDLNARRLVLPPAQSSPSTDTERFSLADAGHLKLKLQALDRAISSIRPDSPSEDDITNIDDACKTNPSGGSVYVAGSERFYLVVKGLTGPRATADAYAEAYKNVLQGRPYANKYKLSGWAGPPPIFSEIRPLLRDIDIACETNLESAFAILEERAKPFPFLRLPAELRLHTYSFLLPPGPRIVLDPSRQHVTRPRLNIMRTNRQIHNEVRKLFYGSRRMFIQVEPGLMDKESAIKYGHGLKCLHMSTTINPTILQLLKELEFQFRKDPSGGCYPSKSWMNPMGRIYYMLKLERISITFTESEFYRLTAAGSTDPKALEESGQLRDSAMETTSPPGHDGATGSALPYADSRLGKLPTELLQSVVHHCSHFRPPSIACISPELRALVERQLYRDVVLGRYSVWASAPRDLWLFYRTILSRPDLSRKTENLDIKVVDRMMSIEVPTLGVVPQGAMFPSTIRAEIEEIRIACALLFWQMTELKCLSLSIVRADEDDDGRPRVVSKCLSKLISHFDNRTAHLTTFPGLQKLRSLKFEGTEFHWILARSPHLEEIVLTRASHILADGASSAINSAVKFLTIPVQSAVLNPDCSQYDALFPFLAHFPHLETLRMPFNDDDDTVAGTRSNFNLARDDEGSYTILFQKLMSVAPVLTRLELDASTHCSEEDTSFLDHVLPADGFLIFKALKHLLVPYQCLFGRSEPQWAHIQQPADEMLPPTLETLEVHFPELAFLDWLTTLSYYRKQLPVLEHIGIACSSWIGGSYVDFAFTSYPHPALDILSSLGIDWSIDVPQCCWRQAWDDYDLRAWDAVAWMDRTFGPSYRGTVYNPTPGDNSELDPPSIIIGEEAKSADTVGVAPGAVVADDDDGDSSVSQFTAVELAILWEASTTLLYE
ncbi:uncharacterized protein J4E84_010103 [Alternaria hordeiaustralica]|uniref:uncharacterized protein n=1 Tax=Alternaria hordeiaustralica TaxID=1187925 RepID=UPI0020C4CBAC|nr:uncharacterized protein J4E84_010103 [Alternaria hordeiaustralica]KAI4675361.1 hypothetical protein J4E84_010103 [Alternaria hordeiaustralica]